MTEYGYGDYVAYDPGYKEPEIGRVTRQGANGGWYVCYHDGCTAACTPEEMLRPATEEEIAKAMPDLGHHRFDESCPEYDPDACVGCRHDRSD